MFTRSNRYLTSSNHITLSRQPEYRTLQLRAQRQRPNENPLLTSWGTRRRFEHVCHDTVRGALLAKGPDSSLGEVHRGSCSEDIHMEEEKVEVKVQEEEVEDGRDK